MRYAHLRAADEGSRDGCREADFLRKPVRSLELLDAVKRGLERAQRRRTAPVDNAPDVETLIRRAEGLVSRSLAVVRGRV